MFIGAEMLIGSGGARLSRFAPPPKNFFRVSQVAREYLDEGETGAGSATGDAVW